MLKKIILGTLLTFLVIACGLIAIGLTVPNHFRVERRISISATPPQIFSHLKDLTLWETWSPWVRQDPKTTFGYGSSTVGLGASYSWNGPKAGQGELHVTDYKENERIAFEMKVTAPWKSTANGEILLTFEENGKDTQVFWFMEARYSSLFEKAFFKILKMEQKLGNDFQEGLAQLKTLSEKKSP